jgi:hypothetical protein
VAHFSGTSTAFGKKNKKWRDPVCRSQGEQAVNTYLRRSVFWHNTQKPVPFKRGESLAKFFLRDIDQERSHKAIQEAVNEVRTK